MVDYQQSEILTELNNIILRDSAKVVLSKLKECNLFCGIYDARNGKESYMYGICCVMEVIASYAGDDEFSGEFIKNMIKSEEKVERDDELSELRSTD